MKDEGGLKMLFSEYNLFPYVLLGQRDIKGEGGKILVINGWPYLPPVPQQ